MYFNEHIHGYPVNRASRMCMAPLQICFGLLRQNIFSPNGAGFSTICSVSKQFLHFSMTRHIQHGHKWIPNDTMWPWKLLFLRGTWPLVEGQFERSFARFTLFAGSIFSLRTHDPNLYGHNIGEWSGFHVDQTEEQMAKRPRCIWVEHPAVYRICAHTVNDRSISMEDISRTKSSFECTHYFKQQSWRVMAASTIRN